MKLLKTLVRRVINPRDHIDNRVVYLPLGMAEQDTIIIKDADKSQAFKIVKIFSDESIILDGDI